jgi:hypothetical protein
MNRPAKLFFEGEAGAPVKRVVALPTEGATLAPIIESAELYVRKREEMGLPLRKADDE